MPVHSKSPVKVVDGKVISGASEGGGDEVLPTAPRNGSGARQDSVRRNSGLKCLVMLATDDGRWDVHGIADVMNPRYSYLINIIQCNEHYRIPIHYIISQILPQDHLG